MIISGKAFCADLVVVVVATRILVIAKTCEMLEIDKEILKIEGY